MQGNRGRLVEAGKYEQIVFVKRSVIEPVHRFDDADERPLVQKRSHNDGLNPIAFHIGVATDKPLILGILNQDGLAIIRDISGKSFPAFLDDAFLRGWLLA